MIILTGHLCIKIKKITLKLNEKVKKRITFFIADLHFLALFFHCQW
jgi:hypothetical protein